jgi:fatty-acyl-CoA synthase
VLNALNTRLDAETIAFILQHGEAKVLLTDREFAPTVGQGAGDWWARRPLVIEVDDLLGRAGGAWARSTYEALLADRRSRVRLALPADEWDAIALNYTSGTTGNPKGVVYHHRGAYLNAMGNVLTWGLPHHPVYLWTLPMFHCNGWCFPWTMTALAGTQRLPAPRRGQGDLPAIADHGVTHMCGAPIVMPTC